ncbi:uncharacterized protein LOC122367597 isoform X1 [Amphibalanus amphitrite]|uniref:uncharacterized protein LOC122367597 isoform X1 n=1 Tax=Amphibalanus amphitrite TaxID=1232801 RepID=UPI001C906B8E|nr:uncharacterized protein LOC122367597 isoform X1 [Amphibalanus amphitrite]
MKTVEYLGAVIGNGMVSMSEARVQHLRSLPVPGDVHELRRALGSFAFVQRWIPGVAETARPLYDALDKDGRQKLHWTDKMKSAFNKLKQQVSDAVALYLPDFTKPFTLVTDASDVGTGAMLANRDGQHLKPLGFFHHALSQHEKRVGPNGDLVCSVQAQTLDLESDLTTTIFSPESGCQIQDVFSRYLLLLPAEDSTAETAARLVRTRWISTFGVPVANAATGFSPFELLFARPARRPESAISTGEEPGAARSPTDEVAERRRLLDVEANRGWIRAETKTETAPSAESSTGSTSTAEDSGSEDDYEDEDEEERSATIRPQRAREAPDRLVVDPRRKT